MSRPARKRKDRDTDETEADQSADPNAQGAPAASSGSDKESAGQAARTDSAAAPRVLRTRWCRGPE
jgi:hypothetical protein